MSMFRPGREACRQRLATRHGRRRAPDVPPVEDAPEAPRYPVGLRRAVAAALLVVLPVAGWLMADGVIVDGRADALAVATQPHLDATLVDVDRWSRGGPFYTVEYEGREYELFNGYPLDETIGAPVRIVFRPDDPEWAIGVTDPSYWVPDPAADTFLHAVTVLGGFGLALVGAWKLLPDDRARIPIFSGPGDPGWEKRAAAIAAGLEQKPQ